MIKRKGTTKENTWDRQYPPTPEKEIEAEVSRREIKEFVWVADIKCKQNVVVDFVTKNELTPQEAFEEEACLYAGSEICDECSYRVKK